MNKLRVVSSFTGVGMFDLGLQRAGMEIIHQIEIDEHCQSVLRFRYPDVPKSKDIHDVQKAKNTIVSDFDVLVGGSPCQSFSVAGRRAGLAGESQLWYEYHRLLVEYQPTWFIWENVPGVLSSGPVDERTGNKRRGVDFAIVLSGFTGVIQRIPRGGWRNSGVANGPFYNISWRVLDARHFGVPQRRRRVFVIGRLAAAGGSPAEILFERESAGWYLQESTAAQENAPPAFGITAADGDGGGKWENNLHPDHHPSDHVDDAAFNVSVEEGGKGRQEHRDSITVTEFSSAPTLPASGAGTARPSISNAAHEFLVMSAFRRTDTSAYVEDDISSTLRKHTDAGSNVVAVPFRKLSHGEYVADDLASAVVKRDSKDARDIIVTPTFRAPSHGEYVADQTAASIRATEAKDPKRTLICVPKAATVDVRNLTTNDEISGTLQHKSSGGYSLNYQNPVIVRTANTSSNGWGILEDGTTHTLGGSNAVITFNGDPTPKLAEGVAPTLRSGQGGEETGVISQMFGLRRFTPVETERLQGLMDDWTRWRDDGKEQSDAQRYAQCGNGGAVPVLEWIGRRIIAYEED